MAEPKGQEAPGRPPGRETYSVGYGPAIQTWHAERTAVTRAAFLLPHLRPGMRLLDCGCGPGSISVGLAKVVAPGQTVGLDMDRGQIGQARAAARGERADNLCFQRGDIYHLPFTEGSFDAAFAHNVLEHLRDPIAALKEMRRVLRQGAVIGIRDPDYGLGCWVPADPLLIRASQLMLRVREHNGGNPHYARHQRELLREAGFARTQGFAFAESQGSPGETWAYAKVFEEVLRGPATAGIAIAEGWAGEADLERMAAAVRAWGERPEAFRAIVDCAALGWVD